MDLSKKINKKAYTNEQKNAINNVSLQKNKNNVFGSFSYEKSKYPSDIDTAEYVNIFGSKLKAIEYTKYLFINLINKIKNNENIFLGDVKLGIDKVFDIPIGYLENGMIKDYNYDFLNEVFNEYYNNGFLTKEEYEEFKKYILPNQDITIEDFNVLNELLRNKIILRWNENEILQGYKKLLPNRIKTIDDALDDKSMFKIDVIFFIDNKYIEVSNFFIIIYNEDNKYYLLNLNKNADFVNEIQKEIEKLYYNNVFYNPLKMVKRMYSLCRYLGLDKYIKILNKLLIRDSFQLGQIKSQIDTLIYILENVKNAPIENIKKQIDNFKSIISRINLNLNKDKIYNIIDFILKNNDINLIIDNLNQIKDMIKPVIYQDIINFLKKYKMIPLDRYYFLPKIMKYNYNNTTYY